MAKRKPVIDTRKLRAEDVPEWSTTTNWDLQPPPTASEILDRAAAAMEEIRHPRRDVWSFKPKEARFPGLLDKAATIADAGDCYFNGDDARYRVCAGEKWVVFDEEPTAEQIQALLKEVSDGE